MQADIWMNPKSSENSDHCKEGRLKKRFKMVFVEDVGKLEMQSFYMVSLGNFHLVIGLCVYESVKVSQVL